MVSLRKLFLGLVCAGAIFALQPGAWAASACEDVTEQLTEAAAHMATEASKDAAETLTEASTETLTEASTETLTEPSQEETTGTEVYAGEGSWRSRLADLYLENLSRAKITYTFGSEKVVLGRSTTAAWIKGDSVLTKSIDRNAVTAYVQELADTYNTRNIPRSFGTTDGRTIVFNERENYYGYGMRVEAEVDQLMQELVTGRVIEREPVYRSTDEWGTPLYYHRDGNDDLMGSYVEVDLTNQHVWFYKDGKLIVESPCVTGSVALGKETIPGVYPIAYKKRDAVLKGQGYTQPVSYWMPFNEGQGLHDASWRSRFGGNIYQNDGSHGCVNLPPDVAKVIFENAEAGMAVVLYK